MNADEGQDAIVTFATSPRRQRLWRHVDASQEVTRRTDERLERDDAPPATASYHVVRAKSSLENARGP